MRLAGSHFAVSRGTPTASQPGTSYAGSLHGTGGGAGGSDAERLLLTGAGEEEGRTCITHGLLIDGYGMIKGRGSLRIRIWRFGAILSGAIQRPSVKIVRNNACAHLEASSGVASRGPLIGPGETNQNGVFSTTSISSRGR